MSNLLSLAFWFDPTPVAFSPVFSYVFFGIFAACAVGAVAASLFKGKSGTHRFYRDGFDSLFMGLGALAIFGFVWLFATMEEVRVFGVRAWFLLWVLLAVVFAVRMYRYFMVEVPRRIAQKETAQNMNQYLPRRSR